MAAVMRWCLAELYGGGVKLGFELADHMRVSHRCSEARTAMQGQQNMIQLLQSQIQWNAGHKKTGIWS